MNDLNELKAEFKQRYAKNSDVLSVVAIENTDQDSSLSDEYDLSLLIVTSGSSVEDHHILFHYIKDPYRIQERWVDYKQIHFWILNGQHRGIVQSVLQGDILLDKDNFLEGMRHRLLEFPQKLRNQRLLVEFSQFLKWYLSSKQRLEAGHVLDAYSDVLMALKHWVRIAIIEHAVHPEVMVWRQVRKLNPGVYKLYEELISNNETLEKRIQLVLLGCEFAVISKMQECCYGLLEVLSSRDTPWNIDELNQHPALKGLQLDMSLILKKMADRALIKRITVNDSLDQTIAELKYTVCWSVNGRLYK